ncbi:MAG: N-6 DNA methylase, partial [Bacteroidetes bacterium]|nr:N-6 DNA methylase [Bacteroidota bacterium]
MLDNTTKRQIDSARDILVGKVPDPKAQIDQITTAMIYKFMDDMDKEAEELGGKARFFADNLADYSWTKLMDTKLSGDERINFYKEGIEKLKIAPNIPELFRNIFKNYYLPFYDQRTLSLFLKEINEFSYDNSENLGNAFEYLLSILGSQGDAGQFRTPRHIIDFIVSVVDPKKNETILDPACGTAGFLISAYKHIIKTNSSNYKPEQEAQDLIVQGSTATETIITETVKYAGDKLTPDDRTKLTQNIAGYDIDSNMVKLALVNLYLHGFPNPKITEYDTLSSEKRWDENFDVILANPPFMTPKGGIVPHKRFSIQANRAEVLFVDYIAEHLSIKGRAGIIVPEGIIFQSANAYKNLRKNLIENWGLYAVVSLPSGVFQPYSGVKTSILLLDKEVAKRTDEILFLKVENDGFDLGAQRRKSDKNDLPDCFHILNQWKKDRIVDESSKFAFAVKKEKIAENGDYNLTGDRYR